MPCPFPRVGEQMKNVTDKYFKNRRAFCSGRTWRQHWIWKDPWGQKPSPAIRPRGRTWTERLSPPWLWLRDKPPEVLQKTAIYCIHGFCRSEFERGIMWPVCLCAKMSGTLAGEVSNLGVTLWQGAPFTYLESFLTSMSGSWGWLSVGTLTGGLVMGRFWWTNLTFFVAWWLGSKRARGKQIAH